jgi:hypothetical protein
MKNAREGILQSILSGIIIFGLMAGYMFPYKATGIPLKGAP